MHIVLEEFHMEQSTLSMQSQLENRFIKLSYSICWICNKLRKNSSLKEITDQLIESSADASLSYLDLQDAESNTDYLKNKVTTQNELQKTSDDLKFLCKIIGENEKQSLKLCMEECDQLIAIFQESIIAVKSFKK